MDLFVHVLISREAIWQKKRHRCTLPRVANSACLQSGLQEGTSKRKTMLPKPGVPSAACYMLVLCTTPMPILQSLYIKKKVLVPVSPFFKLKQPTHGTGDLINLSNCGGPSPISTSVIVLPSSIHSLYSFSGSLLA